MITAIDMIGTSLGSGTKTYNLNFCENLSKSSLRKKIYIFITKDYFKNLSNIPNEKIKYIVKSNFLNNIFFRILWMQFFLPIELKILKVDQLFSPMNMGPVLLKFFNIKFILALHSNLPWVFFSKMPGNLFRNFLTKYLMEVSVRCCDKLIVDSEFAKKEIINLLNLNKDKVFSVHLGVSQKYLVDEENNFYIKDFEYKNYFISVLSCVRYHNIISLLKAFKLFKLENKSKLKFVFVLQILDKNYFREINNFVEKNFKTNEIIFLNKLDSNYLKNLYKYAKFYIFSSYCEVFGLTSLEAMSQGCPVIISNKSALKEINSDAALYFNPDDENDIKENIKKILFNENLKNETIKKANLHYIKFSWKKTVNETLKILEQ